MNNIYEGRLQKYQGILNQTYVKIYKNFGAKQKDFDSLLETMKHRYIERSASLIKLDARPKKWYMSKDMIGYMVYTDLFSRDLKNLISKIPYLKELGITYVHLMPVLKPRLGENDGGYAVEDYLDIDPKLGTLDDFNMVLEVFRNEGIDVCIDYVINHTSDTHEWARKALKGDQCYQDMYIMYDDRKIPDLFDQFVPEVLPDKCPGNFTYKHEINKWVFTSFSDFQWDLNFKNPLVFEKMVDIMLQLANKGVNIIRLDAIPFMWKEVGTNCRNRPEIHDLIYMLQIIKDIVCPSLAILGEAIVEPHEIIKYFGNEDKMECGLLYNANFMVNVWNAFATRDTRLLNFDNSRFVVPTHSCWMNYIRCHDDIGWGLNEDELERLGISAFHHKQYLIDFFSGQFPDSFSKGENYQYNEISEDARTNGTCASLLGLEKAVEEKYTFDQEVAIKRVLLAHSMILSHQGIPLIYSGDEIATLNDQIYKLDPDKANDSRWVHRPIFDWNRALNRNVINTFENKVFQSIRQMIKIRKDNKLFNGDVKAVVIPNSEISIYSFYKKNEREQMVFMQNFSEHIKYASSSSYHLENISDKMIDLLTGRLVDFKNKQIRLAPYEVLWLKADL
jgi:amylosucrase